MKRYSTTMFRRGSALLLALLLAFSSLAALAMPGEQPVILELHYQQPDGTPQVIPAQPVIYPGFENAFWLHVTPEAQADPGASLHISDLLAQYPGGFSIQNGTPANMYYAFATDALAADKAIPFFGLGEGNVQMAEFRLFISLGVAEPPPPEVEIQPADITVIYLDQNDQEITRETRTLQPGANTVMPTPGLVPGNYELTGQGEYTVNVTEQGPDMTEVYFRYQVQIQPADITVIYLDQNDQEITRETRTLQPGPNTVMPTPGLVPANYELTGQGEYTVTVTEHGPDMTEVYFRYQVQIQPADITVIYLDQNDQEITRETRTLQPGPNTVMPTPGLVPGNYELTGQGEYTVNVTEHGPDMTEVYFRYQVQVQPADITVIYLDQNDAEITRETRTLQPGPNTVVPTPGLVPGNYELTGQGEYTVTVTEQGADMTEVYFRYQVQVQPADITVIYLDQNDAEITRETRTLQPGANTVVPTPGLVPDNYQLTGQGEYTVTVTEQGLDMTEVYFRYQVQVQPADITVIYLDQNDQEITRETRTLQPGANTVMPTPGLVPGNYELTGQGEYTVTVTEQGADMTEVYFRYQVQIQAADITVIYLDQDNAEITRETRTLQPGPNTVTPDASLVPANFELTGQGEYTINVTEQGPDMAEVIFRYQVQIQAADITVIYLDQDNAEITRETRTLQPGANTVTPDASLVPQDYQLTGQGEYTVNVTEQGADTAEVIFRYERIISPVEVTIHYRDITDGHPVADSVTRSFGPGTHEVYAQPENLKEGYTLAGPDVQSLTVNEAGAFPSEIIFEYNAPQAIEEPTQAPTEEPIPDAQVTVRYVDEKGNQVADTQVITLPAGPHNIKPAPVNLLQDYVFVGPASFDITVDINGASQTEVAFVYQLDTPVSQPVNITVSYVDSEGTKVASDTVFTAGEGKHPVPAAPTDLMEGFTLKEGEDATKYVNITNNVATPASLTFIYEKVVVPTPTPAPPPKAALVKVSYLAEDPALPPLYTTTVPCKEGEETVIEVNLNNINTSMYQLVGESRHVITVDSNGNPSQQEVVFLFKDITVKTATIRIHFRDQEGKTLAPTKEQTLQPGTTSIHPQPEGLPEGYVLSSQSPVDVVLSQSGALSHEEVVFVYAKPATATPVITETPEPTTIPFDVTTMDRYAYPTGDGINFRNSPDTSQKDNVITTLNASDLVHILGSIKNRQGEEWYLADVNGQEGFLKATVAKLLTFNEVAAIFGWTPEPSATPAPSSDPMKDGEIIDRWAEVTVKGGVNLRAKASKSSSRITSLETGERIWVYTQQTEGKDIWYKVRAGGKDGYVMAEYTRLYSLQESETYQATLASPMPYQVTPTPTAAPATTPPPATDTPAPTALPSASPTPPVYQGPALTIRQTPLNTGIGRQDEQMIEMLEVNTLVQVWNQTWIEDVGWSQVQVIADKQIGYVPNAALRYIDDQEAAFYLAQLPPAVTEPPAPTRQPDQRVGYSISRGENVPMRAFPDTNARIISMLPEGAVVGVRGQDYSAGASWDVVQYGDQMGYVRSDQLRMLSATEEKNYLDSLRSPTPAVQHTPEPVNLNSPSSYGHVTADRVRLRSEASTSSRELKLMSKNAFALVYSSVRQQDGVWYHISQDGTVGYVREDFFKVLPMGELSTFLQSQDYLNANAGSLPNTGGYQQQGQITPLENYNNTVWQNPNLVNPSYEPFNPLGSPTPAVEAIESVSPSPSVTPTATLMTVEGFEEPPEKPDSGFPVGLLAVGIIAILGGGGYYAYHLYNQNQKRAAARAAQRRAQVAQQAGQPQARPATPGTPQGTSAYRPPQARPGQTPPVTPQGTTQYRPPQQPGTPGQTPPVAQQGTAQYRPPQPGAPGQTPPTAPQGTAQYRPPQPGTPGQTPPVTPQGTTQYRPPQPGTPGQTPPVTPQGTTQYRPPQQPGTPGQTPPTPPQATAPVKPVQGGQAQKPAEPAPKGPEAPAGDKPQAPEQRRRRSDRHGNT